MSGHSPTHIEMEAVASQMHKARLPPDMKWQDRFMYRTQLNSWKGIPLETWPLYLVRAIWFLNIDPEHSFSLGFFQVRLVIEQLQTIHSGGAGFELSEFIELFVTRPEELPLPTPEDLAGLREQLADVDAKIERYVDWDQQEIDRVILDEDTDNLIADFGDVAMETTDKEMRDVDAASHQAGATYSSSRKEDDVSSDDEDYEYIRDLRAQRQKLVALLGAPITPPTDLQVYSYECDLNEAFQDMDLDGEGAADATQSARNLDMSALERTLRSISGEYAVRHAYLPPYLPIKVRQQE
ncbi:hypothetical protein LTS18_009272 [Coniosporium uncinatum]|uniref:Uncharacterized protein n=1 Tax=Coniosporium uncinatum TaxID=93489 RepID=A0ACC3DD70_9PEZI|nr:hypothetical protein LTS18_009272 [Coniosporium uncinatum]